MDNKVILRVSVNGEYGSFYANIEASYLYGQQFETLRQSDNDFLSAIACEPSAAAARVFIKTRKNAAEILSRELTKMIIDAMKAKDTHNGYPATEDND